MSSLSIPLSRKIPERQFLGDLMSLFQRRKLKCGDAQIFEIFTSDLATNNILRSDLFTLCTAISHMAAEDLSGEELLALVARALGGAGVAKGGAPAEIPESMRSAFLDGYKAWSNRGSALGEPLLWPPVRQTAPREELPPKPVVGDAASDPTASTESAETYHTVQEALHIARERAGSPLTMPRLAAPAANLEHLTISELKQLMAEIEHQVSRIGPQADPTGAAVGCAGTDGADERAAEPAAPLVTPEAALPPAGIETAAPSANAVALSASTDVAPATPVAAPPPAAVIEPASFARPGPFEAPPSINRVGPRIRFRISLRGIVLIAALFLVTGGSAGLCVYHSLRLKTIDNLPDLKALVSSGSSAGEGSTVSRDGGSNAEVILSASDDPLMGMNSPAAGSDAQNSVRPKLKAKEQSTKMPPVAVWPQTSPAVSGAAGANAWTPSAGALAVTRHAAGSGAAAETHRPESAEGPLHVRSTTMMEYAVSVPKPVYPPDIPKGITGTVVVEVAISREGIVTGARAVSGPDDLRPATVQAVQGWRFGPYTVDGNPAEVTTTLGFFFNGR